MEDPYKVLGVARDATDAQIRSAYVKLAKTTHPDLNPGDAAAEERFKAVGAAYELLSDAARRGRYDRGEIDAAGQEKPQRHYYREHAEGPAGAHYGSAPGAGFEDEELGDILSELFRQHGQTRGPRRGADRRYTLGVPFLDAVRGTTSRIALPDGAHLDVRIPPGIESGQILRLRGKGASGEPAGDALIEVTVEPHPLFRRVGRDIHLDLPVSVTEAVLGQRVNVPTVTGPVTMTIPAGSDTGTRLRLRGKGVPAAGNDPAGDAYATLRVMIGPADAGLAEFLRNRTDGPAWDPRAGLEYAA